MYYLGIVKWHEPKHGGYLIYPCKDNSFELRDHKSAFGISYFEILREATEIDKQLWLDGVNVYYFDDEYA